LDNINYQSYFGKGVCLWNLGDNLDEMEKSFSECILLKINHFEAIFYRGRINLIKGFVKEA
jgi:hypothetical protein